MPNRYSNTLHLWIYSFLIMRDGPNCTHCGKPPKEGEKLEIHHNDNDKSNDDPPNLRLVHGRCNKLLEIAFREERKANKGKKAESVSIEGSPATRIVRALVDFSSGSAEMQANSHYETKYRTWIIEKIKAEGGYSLDEAYKSGAEKVGCSVASTKRYTEKLTSGEGPLQIFEDATGTKNLVFKEKIMKALIASMKSQPIKKKRTGKKPGPKPKNKPKEVKDNGKTNKGTAPKEGATE